MTTDELIAAFPCKHDQRRFRDGSEKCVIYSLDGKTFQEQRCPGYSLPELLKATASAVEVLIGQGHEPFTETEGSARMAEMAGMAAHPIGTQWCAFDGEVWPCPTATALSLFNRKEPSHD